MTMSFAGWQRNKWLTAHKSSPEEIAALLAIAERDPEQLCRQIVERGFYLSWDAARGLSGGGGRSERTMQPVQADALPVAPNGTGRYARSPPASSGPVDAIG
jgi:hypothetical protein